MRKFKIFFPALALIGVISILACERKQAESSQGQGGAKALARFPPHSVLVGIDSESGGHCWAPSEVTIVNNDEQVVWVPNGNSTDVFDIDFVACPSSIYGCTPGCGTPFGSPHFSTSGSGTDKAHAMPHSCYKYTITVHGASKPCNDPNVIVK